MGIGYARMCIQLVAFLMGMRSIWMLDDNISDCWRLPYEHFVEHKQHSQLEAVKFDEVMIRIEKQVSTADAGPMIEREGATCQCLPQMQLLPSTALQSRHNVPSATSCQLDFCT